MPVRIIENNADTCLDLVKRFPLAPIKGDTELTAARNMIAELLERDLDTGAQVYFDVLTDLVEDYEDEHVLIPDASQSDVLRELMTVNGLSQSKLAKEVGVSPSTISAVLNGMRSLNKEQVAKVAKFFHVSPSVFWPRD